MKHKVKVTVLDKNYIPNYSRNTVQIRIRESVRATMSVMNLFFIATVTETTFGISD